jgi:hypothetical protein
MEFAISTNPQQNALIVNLATQMEFANWQNSQGFVVIVRAQAKRALTDCVLIMNIKEHAHLIANVPVALMVFVNRMKIM